jgi:hypothetical protein
VVLPVNISDGLQEVVRLIHDDDAVSEVEPDGPPRGGMKERVVWEHDYLA